MDEIEGDIDQAESQMEEISGDIDQRVRRTIYKVT